MPHSIQIDLFIYYGQFFSRIGPRSIRHSSRAPISLHHFWHDNLGWVAVSIISFLCCTIVGKDLPIFNFQLLRSFLTWFIYLTFGIPIVLFYLQGVVRLLFLQSWLFLLSTCIIYLSFLVLMKLYLVHHKDGKAPNYVFIAILYLWILPYRCIAIFFF